jgi:hypothetical protein
MPGSEEDGSDLPWQLDLRGSNPGVLVQVRRWAATALADLGDGHLGDVMLVAIELVTNAFDHGGGPRTIRMRRSRMPCVVGIDVEDSDIGRLTPGTSRFGGYRGRGLVIVDKLSATWGIRPPARDWQQDRLGAGLLRCGPLSLTHDQPSQARVLRGQPARTVVADRGGRAVEVGVLRHPASRTVALCCGGSSTPGVVTVGYGGQHAEIRRCGHDRSAPAGWMRLAGRGHRWGR